jgi:hypothetical protein
MSPEAMGVVVLVMAGFLILDVAMEWLRKGGSLRHHDAEEDGRWLRRELRRQQRHDDYDSWR